MSARLLPLFAIACVALAQTREPVDRAWDLIAAGKRGEAVRLLRQIVGANPRHGEARLLLGSILFEEGSNPEAIEQLSEAVRLMPASPQAHNGLGEALRAAGDLEPARAAFAKAVALDPKFAEAHASLGHILLDAGDMTAAAGHLDRAIAIFGRAPEAAYPHYLRAKLFTQGGDPDRAAAHLADAVSLRPEFAEAWSDLGEARKTLLDDDGAFAAFRRSVELNPENAVSQYRLGAEYLRRGKPHEAVAHLRESDRLNPLSQTTLYSLQSALRQDGQPEEAARIKQKLSEVLREIDRESRDAFSALRLNNEGAAMEKRGDLRGAVDKYRAAVTLDPTHAGIRTNFAVALLRLGAWKEGLEQLREATRRDPANPQIRAALNDALEQAPREFGGKAKAVAPPKPGPPR